MGMEGREGRDEEGWEWYGVKIRKGETEGEEREGREGKRMKRWREGRREGKEEDHTSSISKPL